MPFREFLPSKYVFDWGKLCGNFTILKQVDCGEDIKGTVKIFFSAQFYCVGNLFAVVKQFIKFCLSVPILLSCAKKIKFVSCWKKKHWKNFNDKLTSFSAQFPSFQKNIFFPFPQQIECFRRTFCFSWFYSQQRVLFCICEMMTKRQLI